MKLDKKFLIGLFISVIFLYMAVRKIEFGTMYLTLKKANYFWLVPALFIYIFEFWIKSFRWKIIFSSIAQAPTKFFFPFLMIGFFVNNTFPARIGEIVRAYLLGKKIGVSKSSAFATVVLERVFDGISLVIILIIVLFFLPDIPFWIKRAGIYGAVIFLVLLSFLFFILHNKNFALKISDTSFFPARFKERFNHVLSNFISGLEILKSGKELVFIIIPLSLFVWFVDGFALYIVSRAFDLNITVFGGMFVLIVLAMGVAIPSSPSYVGTYEYFGTTALILLLPNQKSIESTALGFVLVLHGFQFIITAIIGSFCLIREHISFAEIKS